MTRLRHVTPGRTVERLDRLRILVGELQSGEMSRAAIGALLEMGPSGVRKYLVDLRGMIALRADDGDQVCRWTASADATRAYLATLSTTAAAAPARPRPAVRIDTSRHIHIMRDDEHFAVRVLRGIPAHEGRVLVP
jgi:hypothetical protein